MYCPYCGTNHPDTATGRSIEHVIPYGLGGCDGLTIVTCHKSNNDLGSRVDAPFMDSFLIRAKRFFLGLESNKGNPPTFDLGGTGWINGMEVPVSYLISEKTKDLRLSKPLISKTVSGKGAEHWHIFGDPAQVRQILEGKLRKQMSLGKSITLDDGSLLRMEDLDGLFSERTTTTLNPSVLKTIEHDYLEFARFFSKLALATGYLHYGETFSRSATGGRLRQNMNALTIEEIVSPGHIWPEIASVERALGLIAKDQHHTLAIMEGEVPVLMISLFGEIGAVIPLGEAPQGRLPRMSNDGTVWRIALPSRVLSKSSVIEMIRDKLAFLRET